MEKDIVFHLGDFGDFSALQKLNGKIYLILGNYEEQEMKAKYLGNFENYRSFLLSLGFANVYEKGKEILIDNQRIFLTHKPSNCKNTSFNLFGHVHKACMCKKFGLNVGVDCFSGYPVSTEEVLHFKNATENHYDNEVFIQQV